MKDYNTVPHGVARTWFQIMMQLCPNFLVSIESADAITIGITVTNKAHITYYDRYI